MVSLTLSIIDTVVRAETSSAAQHGGALGRFIGSTSPARSGVRPAASVWYLY